MYLYLFSLFLVSSSLFLFFFNDTATTEIYTLSLHDALPILSYADFGASFARWECCHSISIFRISSSELDRKSTRLNSSHTVISYAVFCLKKKKNKKKVLVLKT